MGTHVQGMSLLRLTKLSIYYFIKERLVADGYNNISIRYTYPTDDEIVRMVTFENSTGSENEIVLPVVAITINSTREEGFELGGGQEIHRQVVVDIFAEDDGQSEDLSEFIKDYFDYRAALYDYNEGFPPSVTPTQIGKITFENARIVLFNNLGNSNVGQRHHKMVFVDSVTYRDLISD